MSKSQMPEAASIGGYMQRSTGLSGMEVEEKEGNGEVGRERR